MICKVLNDLSPPHTATPYPALSLLWFLASYHSFSATYPSCCHLNILGTLPLRAKIETSASHINKCSINIAHLNGIEVSSQLVAITRFRIWDYASFFARVVSHSIHQYTGSFHLSNIFFFHLIMWAWENFCGIFWKINMIRNSISILILELQASM